MRYAIVSDLHANLHALRTVLRFARRRAVRASGLRQGSERGPEQGLPAPPAAAPGHPGFPELRERHQPSGTEPRRPRPRDP